jgi:succinoglycan biosynthesis transport protein ExoP
MNKIARQTTIPLNGPIATDFPVSDNEATASSVPISHYAWILGREWWKILLFVVAMTTAAFVISSRITPIYESTATIDIDRQTPSGVVGQDSNRSLSNDTEQFLATQIKLVQSDSVIRPVAEKYHLLEHEKQQPSGAASADSQDEPTTLKNLKVTRPINTFLLLITYQSPDRHLAADVANGIAQSYLAHSYDVRFRSASSLTTFMEKQTDELRAKMERSSAALLKFERELNLVSPEEKTNILVARLLQLNTELTNAQADRVRKEATQQSVSSGVPQAVQASQLGEPLGKLTERINELQEKFSEVRSHYGTAHPDYKKIEAQLAELQRLHAETSQNIVERAKIGYDEAVNRETILRGSVQEAKAEFDSLNAHSFEYQALKREAESDKNLYDELLRKIREAGINANFQNSSIRIADEARPSRKVVFPRTGINMLLAFLFSLLVAVAAAIVRDTLDNTIRDPEAAARTMNTHVLGSLPVVKTWQGHLGLAEHAEGAQLVAMNGAIGSSSNSYNEAIRTVRSSILLSGDDPRARSLLVTSASPGEGKSTIASQLAATHALQGQRTLLIDGDLRRPRIHRRLGISTAIGLSSVLLRETSWREALSNVQGLPALDVLPAGPPLRRATDLIGRGLAEIIDEAVLDYDLVIVDGPPMLGFAEPLQMATIVDSVVVVVRAGQTSRKMVATVLNTLTRLRAHVTGLVLNQVHREMSQSYEYYKSYGKYYDANVEV